MEEPPLRGKTRGIGTSSKHSAALSDCWPGCIAADGLRWPLRWCTWSGCCACGAACCLASATGPVVALAVKVAHRPGLAVDLLHLVEPIHLVDLAAIVADHQRPGCSAPVDAVWLRWPAGDVVTGPVAVVAVEVAHRHGAAWPGLAVDLLHRVLPVGATGPPSWPLHPALRSKICGSLPGVWPSGLEDREILLVGGPAYCLTVA